MFDPEQFTKELGDALKEGDDAIRSEVAATIKAAFEGWHAEHSAIVATMQKAIDAQAAQIADMVEARAAAEEADAAAVADLCKTICEVAATVDKDRAATNERLTTLETTHDETFKQVEELTAKVEGIDEPLATLSDLRKTVDEAGELLTGSMAAVADFTKATRETLDTHTQAIALVNEGMGKLADGTDKAAGMIEKLSEKQTDTAAIVSALVKQQDATTEDIASAATTLTQAMATLREDVSKDVDEALSKHTVDTDKVVAAAVAEASELVRGAVDAIPGAEAIANMVAAKHSEHIAKFVVAPKGDKGDKGEQGEPGFELDDFSVEQVGDEVHLTFARGDLTKTLKLRLPGVRYKNIYRDDTDYEPGDAATFGGSLWVTVNGVKAGSARPGTSEDKAWVLAVKKGRDGKNYEPPAPKKGPVKLDD